jgi:large subunit ribosomal protein L24
MNKLHVKKGDEVVIIAGSNKGKRGRIIAAYPKKLRVVVEGAAMIKKHMRKNQQNPNGAIVEREGSIHVSNVMHATRFDERAAKRASKATA